MGSLLTLVAVSFKAFLLGLVLLIVAAGWIVVFGYQSVAQLLQFLIQNWVLQTILGAWVAFRFQELASANSRQNQSVAESYARKTEAVKVLLSLIQTRLYASRRYLAVIEAEPTEIASEREHYRAVVAEWNERAKVVQITILMEFPGYFGLDLDHTFFPLFAEIDALLRRQRIHVQGSKKATKATSVKINTLLHAIDRRSIDLSRDLIRVSKRDRDILDETMDIKLANFEHISYPRLLKAIFQPS